MSPSAETNLPTSLNTLPHDIIEKIGHLLLDDELPDATGALLPLSQLDPGAGWRHVVPADVCAITDCWVHLLTPRGYDGYLTYRVPKQRPGEISSLVRLTQVDRKMRATVFSLRGLWARGVSAHVKALDLFAPYAAPTPIQLVSPSPQCACKTSTLLRWTHAARSISLTLPAYTPMGDDLSHAYCNEIRATSTQLDELELRFATPTGRLADTGALYEIPLLTNSRQLNTPGAFVGPRVRSLHLGQQSPRLRWSAVAVCAAILACPLLEDLSLHTVFKPHVEAIPQQLLPPGTSIDSIIDTDIADLPHLSLEHLRSLYLSDDWFTCRRILRQFATLSGDLHVDAVTSFGDNDLNDSHEIGDIMRGLQPLVTECRRHFEAGVQGEVAIVTYLPDITSVTRVTRANEVRARNRWPERVFVGKASTIQDAELMAGSEADFSPLPGRRRCSLSFRNDAMSTRPRSELARGALLVDAPNPPRVVGEVLQTVAGILQLGGAKALVLASVKSLPESITDWRDVLCSFQQLEVIRIASESGQVHKSLSLYLRNETFSSQLRLTWPLINLHTVVLATYTEHRNTSWTTREAFNARMRRQMSRSPRVGNPINWVAERLPA